MFSVCLKANFNVWVTSILLSANALDLDQSRTLSFSKALDVESVSFVEQRGCCSPN